MPLQVTSDNLEITPSMKTLAESKVSKIINRLGDVPADLVDMRVVLNKGAEEGTFVTKIEFSIGSKMTVGDGFGYKLESAVIKAVDDTLRQYKKEKEKKESENWKERRDMKVFQDTEKTDEEAE